MKRDTLYQIAEAGRVLAEAVREAFTARSTYAAIIGRDGITSKEPSPERLAAASRLAKADAALQTALDAWDAIGGKR